MASERIRLGPFVLVVIRQRTDFSGAGVVAHHDPERMVPAGFFRKPWKLHRRESCAILQPCWRIMYESYR